MWGKGSRIGLYFPSQAILEKSLNQMVLYQKMFTFLYSSGWDLDEYSVLIHRYESVYNRVGITN